MCVKGVWEFSAVGVADYNGNHVGVLWTMDRQGRGRQRDDHGRGDCGDHYHDHYEETDTFSKWILN